MNSLSLRFVFVFLWCVVVAHGGAGGPCEAIINFGDSLSDTGTYATAIDEIRAPNGDTYFGAPAGRISDGRLIIDFMAESLRIPYLSAYLNAVNAKFTHGVNFATSGAAALHEPCSWSPFPLPVQYYHFSQFLAKSKLFSNKQGILPKLEVISRALYTVDIGLNDVMYSCLVFNTPEFKVNKIGDIVNQFNETLKSLYKDGARAFWIHNVGPFGCHPNKLVNAPAGCNDPRYTLPPVQLIYDSVGCLVGHNQVAQQFNSKLKELVVQLRRECPLASFTYVDIFAAKYTLISQTHKLGFVKPLEACCGHGGIYNYNDKYPCGKLVKENETEIYVGKCEDIAHRISWDGTHYTEAANKWVSDQIVSGKYTDPPTPLHMACPQL